MVRATTRVVIIFSGGTDQPDAAQVQPGRHRKQRRDINDRDGVAVAERVGDGLASSWTASRKSSIGLRSPVTTMTVPSFRNGGKSLA
jgi:hypothetical protein